MARVSFQEFKRIQRLGKARKSRRTKDRVELDKLDKAASKAQGRPVSKPKLPPLKTLRKILKRIVSQGVQIRDKRLNKGLCLTCSAEPIYAAGHIIPDSESLNTRYDPYNLYGVCRRCNLEEKHNRSKWGRVDGVFWRVFGLEKMIELSRRASVDALWGRADYQQKIEEAKVWLTNILAGGSE